jgi:hypothetical protein
MGECAFCQAKSVKLSAEHVWGQWISELLGRRETRQEHRHDGVLRKWESLGGNLTTKVVCKKCNETWMSDIESRMKRSFSQAIRDGASLSILFRGVCLLAAFAFEKAVVTDYLHLKNAPFFKSVARYRFRESLDIPDGIQIWLAAYAGRAPYRLYYARHSEFDVHSRANLDLLPFTYVAGHLVIQLVAVKWQEKLSTRPVPRVESEASFDSATVQFWPPDGFPVSWPPPQYFDDSTITTFAGRFDNDVLLVRHRKP